MGVDPATTEMSETNLEAKPHEPPVLLEGREAAPQQMSTASLPPSGRTGGGRYTDVVVHAVRTAVAAAISILVARLFRLPESYWAAITTLVITQSSLGAALQISWDRLTGTALCALVAAVVASYFAPNLPVYGVSIFFLGILSVAARSNRNAYRLGVVALTIVLLIPHTGPAWRVAWHRFAEVAIGIVVALLMTWVWPDTEATGK